MLSAAILIQLVTWLNHSIHEGMINKALGPGAADEEFSRGLF